MSATPRYPNPDEPSYRSEPFYVWDRGAWVVHGDTNSDAVGYSRTPATLQRVKKILIVDLDQRKPSPKQLRKKVTLGPMQTSYHP